MNSTQSLVAPSDIAEMADVSRAAVSNWRKRAEDFPAPVAGTPAKPLFARDDIVWWLKARGHEIREDHGESQVWAAMNTLRGELPADEAGALILTLACARKLSDQTQTRPAPWDVLCEHVTSDGFQALGRAVDQCAATEPRWAELVALTPRMLAVPPKAASITVDRLNHVPLHALAEVADFILAKLARASIRGGLEHGFVESRISATLGALAAPAGAGVLYDPACGIGTALTAATAAGFAAEYIVGHDINSNAATQAAQRAFLRGLQAEISTVDVIAVDPDPNLRADVVIAEPPYGIRLPTSFNPTDRRWKFGLPAKNASELAWIQHTVTHLSEAGTGFLITPVSTLFRGGSERAARAELVRRGCVEAVITLPAKMLPHVGIHLVAWVLRAPRETERLDIAFVDGTGTPDVENHIGAWLTALRTGTGPNVAYQQVDIREVLAADTDLNPNRWIQVPDRDPAEVATAYRDSWASLVESLRNIHGSGQSLQHFAGTTDTRLFTIADLADQGLIELRQGRTGTSDVPDHLQQLVVTPRHIRDNEIALPPDTTALPSRLRNAVTEEGDVLVTTQSAIAALVDDSGGHLLGSGVYRLRVTNGEHLTPRYLALVLAGSWNERFLAGTTIPRADLRLLEVPLVPLTEQREVILADIAVRLVAEEAEKLQREAARVRQGMLDALRYNIELPGEPI